MASAVLASQNESGWAPMVKILYANPHLIANPNPRKKQKKFHNAAANGVLGRYHQNGIDIPVVTQSADGDAYSFDQTSAGRKSSAYGAYLSFNVAAYTKSEVIEFRKRLSLELDQIRRLQDRIDSGQFNSVKNPRSHPKSKKVIGNKRPVAVSGSVPKKPCNGDGSGGFNEAVDCESLLKECSKIVAKLMKHKHGHVFKAPVDAVGLGLHDYHLIVKQPMDLGTVRSNIAKNVYQSASEFAADVRLTFNNALLYNPKNDPYNVMAEQMLARFDDLFRPVQEKLDIFVDQRREVEFEVKDGLRFRPVEDLQGSSWNNHILASSVKRKKANPKASHVPDYHVVKGVERCRSPMQAHSSASTPLNPTNQQRPVAEPLRDLPTRVQTVASMEPKLVKVGRKPNAKDPNKREMTMEEKQKLGTGLQSLPQEKMPQLLHIVRKRNQHLAQDGDEIELDIEALDVETVWELDRFVTNWKKQMSKIKRQALVPNSDPPPGVVTPSALVETKMVAASDINNDDSGGNGDDLVKKSRENEDEDVDIEDDMPATFPPVEIEKDEGPGGQGQDHDDVDNASGSSSSSSSGSSSSSDSESGSSSDDDARS